MMNDEASKRRFLRPPRSIAACLAAFVTGGGVATLLTTG
jgi:hypothetical protein